MNKVVAVIIIISLFVSISSFPFPRGLIINHQNYITSASTQYVKVSFILNESKTIFTEYATSWGSEYDLYISQSEVALVPANITLFIFSRYPFEVNGEYAVWAFGPNEYVKNISITNNTILYIDFLTNPPPSPKNPVPILPLYSQYSQSASSISTQNYSQIIQNSDIKTININIIKNINPGIVLTIVILIIIISIILKMRKQSKK